MEWIEPLAYIAGTVIVILVMWGVKRLTGAQVPGGLKAAIFQVVNAVVLNELNRRVKKVESPAAPPKTLAIMSGAELTNLLATYGIKIKYPLDWMYDLMSVADCERFLKWYKENRPIKPSEYTDDNLDCDKFAWVMRAYALLWMRGKCVFGYMEAESAEPEFKYPNHGFCFMVAYNKKVYYCDPLEVAAPDDKLEPAHQVKSHWARA